MVCKIDACGMRGINGVRNVADERGFPVYHNIACVYDDETAYIRGRRKVVGYPITINVAVEVVTLHGTIAVAVADEASQITLLNSYGGKKILQI